MSLTDAHLQLALQAACAVTTAQGLKFEQAIVLQNLSNVIIHLAPTSVVARVSTTTGTIRAGNTWFVREMTVAKYLTASGAPIIPLSSELDPGVHEHLGLVLSFWRFVQVLEEPLDSYQAGQALRQCHEVLRAFPEELPVLALISEAQQLLHQLISESEFTATDAALLLQIGQRLETHLCQFPMQPVHGDPHFGNVLNTTEGILWTDWEDVMIAPVEWDLASLVASSRVFRTGQDQAEAALNGYGRSFDEAALDCCIEARTFVALVWTIILQRQHPTPQRQARIEGRLRWLRERETP